MIFYDLKFSTARGAQTILKHLKDFVEKYGFATVADLYHYAGYSTVPYHDSIHWGWDNLTKSCVTIGKNTIFYISLPKIKELNTDEWIFQ